MPLNLALPDAEIQCQQLADLIRPALASRPALVGIHSGGVWIAQRLKQILNLPDDIGLIDVSFYRDDYAAKGLHPKVRPTVIGFDVEGRHLILVDDVLYTGRTTRAAVNELFDYGRPAKVELAVLADRGGRELPVAAQYCTWQTQVGADQNLVLTCNAEGKVAWSLEHA